MKIAKIRVILLLGIIFTILFATRVFAVSISVTPSSTTVSPGKSFSVTIKGNDATGRVNISVSGGSASTSSVWIENNSQKITVTAGSSGTVKISATGELSSSAGEDKNVSASASVKIVKPSTGVGSSSGNSSSSSGTTNKKPTTNTTKPVETPKSTDSTLSALSVKEGAISPEFKKDVKEYSLTIPYETSEVNVTATATDSKAKVAIEGNKDLKEGENIVKVLVTAEDGTSTTYTIKVTRKRVPIALKTLVVKYQNENGELIETPLNPVFNFDTLEYTLQDLEYWVEKLNIEATPNIEGATIDIQGADNLQVGENTITITVKIAEENTPEGEEPKEETITYTIKFNKIAEPTLIEKIQDWFKGIFGGISTWYNNNTEKVIVGALGLCIVALIGLSVYIVVDYNKYKDVIAKVKKATELNSNEIATEEIATEEIAQESNIVEEKNIEDNNKNDRPKGGKHF